MNQPENHPEALLDAVLAYIAEAGKRITAGEDVDLKMLEQQVATMCQSIALLPEGEGLPYREKLQQIAAALDALARQLNLQHGQVVEQVQQLQEQKRAHSAYKTAHHLNKPKGEAE